MVMSMIIFYDTTEILTALFTIPLLIDFSNIFKMFLNAISNIEKIV